MGITLKNQTPSCLPLSLEDWLADPSGSFLREPLNLLWADSTRYVYACMWAKFANWLASRQVALTSCTVRHVEDFLDLALQNNIRTPEKTPAERKLILLGQKKPKEQRHRYIRLIELVYQNLIEMGLDCVINPGSAAAIKLLGRGSNETTRFLDPCESELFARFLKAFVSRQPPEFLNPEVREDTEKWAVARDLCLAGVMAGCGVRVEEVKRLAVSCTIAPARLSDGETPVFPTLRIPAAIGRYSREALCFPVAVDALSAWRKWRDLLPSAACTDVLFPSDVRLRRRDQAKTDASLHASSIFRRISKVLTDSGMGIGGNRVGGQTLRNTYAAWLIEAGCTDAQIMDAMGLRTIRSVIRLRTNLDAPVRDGVFPE